MSGFSKNISIFVIEDNPGDFLLIEEYLKEQTINPLIARAKTFAESKKFLGPDARFDVIFLDLSLPDANGKFLVDEIVKIAGNIPIIALTGYSDKDFSVKTLSLGISDYLLKDELSASLLHKSIVYNIERKRISIELKESEKKYRDLFHLSPIPMWVIDPVSLEFLNVNYSAIQNYGYSNSEFLSMNLRDIKPPSQLSDLEKIIEKNKNVSGLLTEITSHVKKNGDIISVEIQSSTIEFNQKKAWLILATDVTEKLKAQNDLIVSEHHYKALVQDGADLITIVDIEGIYKYVSPSSRTIFGVAPHKLLGKNAFDFIHEEDKERVLEQFNALRTTKRVQVTAFRFKNFNNEWIWLETNATNLTDDPAVNGIVCNSRDITLNVNYNLKLSQTVERYEALSKATSDAVWDHDFEIGRTYIAGDGYKNLFGYNISNQFSEDLFWESNIHPEDKELTLLALNNALNDSNVIQSEFEYRFLKANGEYAHVLDRFFIIRENGKALRMLGAKQDITLQKNAALEKEKLIIELTQNNKDLRQFSYITSHNLRGPIANLLGLSSLIDHYKIEDKSLNEVLNGIKKASLMFDDTLKDLTNMLSIKDQTAIPQESLLLETFLEKAVSQNQASIDKIGVKIDSNFSEMPEVTFNKAYCESILFNLLSNSIKYRSPARPLNIFVRTENVKGTVTLKFKDNGLGIDTSLYQDRLFRLYQRFHDHAEGKGLGLFLIKSQMEALGGSIDIESQVGVGTTFILKFKN